MEFYREVSPRFSKRSAFQFPTGWNSTTTDLLDDFISESFNSQRDGILPVLCDTESKKPVCFNSQRDGILPFLFELFCQDRCGFNSQRDGILRFDYLEHKIAYKRFQFPTGWNSTAIVTSAIALTALFQFPTGWNSTKSMKPLDNLKLKVSIPNGMEFYLSHGSPVVVEA